MFLDLISIALLGQFWWEAEAILMRFCGNSEEILGAILMRISGNSDEILVQFWRNFGSNSDEMLGQFWWDVEAILMSC